MQGLEKILEEIEKLHGEAGSECTSEDHYVKRAWEQCIKCVEDIISKHMNFCSGPLISYHLVDQKIALEYLLTNQTECTLGGQFQ